MKWSKRPRIPSIMLGAGLDILPLVPRCRFLSKRTAHLTKLAPRSAFTSSSDRGRLASMLAASDLSPSVDVSSNSFSFNKGSLLLGFSSCNNC